MKKYYIEEHETNYRKIKEQGLMAWDQYHDPKQYDFDNFMMGPFLEKALSLLSFDVDHPMVFEYGCGTGVSSCLLASKGFIVEAIDISTDAIELAKKFAYQRGSVITYSIGDITECPYDGKQYDLVIDNYCLQSIVTDKDRASLFTNVLLRLKRTGYYIIATAMYNPENNYTHNYFDTDTGIVYKKIIENPNDYKDSIYKNNDWWIPNRRHLTNLMLLNELTRAGFNVILQENGNVICKIHS